MASAPANDVAEPIVAGEIILVPVAAVAIGERLRPIDMLWATALGGVMAREGQQTPIEVCRLAGKHGWQLVAGAHRLTGAAAVGMEMIEAREVSSAAVFRKMREASENLWRRGLDPIGRAAHVAELVRLHKLRAGVDPASSGQAAAANARWQKELRDEANDANRTLTIAYGFAETVADELGFSRSSVERDLMLYRRLAPSLISKLRLARHPVATNATQLRALAKLDGDAQARVVELLLVPGASLGHGVPKSVADAIALADHFAGRGKPKPDAGAKRLSAFLSAYQRMSLAEKKGALAHLADLLPAGISLTEIAA